MKKRKLLFICIIALIIIIAVIIVIGVKTRLQENVISENITSWNETLTLLKNREVKYVCCFTRDYSSIFTLELKNGTILQTKEPAFGDLIAEIKNCGDPCKGILIGTE